LSKVIDGIVNRSGYMAGILLLAVALTTGYEVAARYIFNSPTIWSMDLGVYLLLWFVFTSLAFVHRAGRHITVDILTSRFPPRTKEIWDILITILFLFIMIPMFFASIQFTAHAFNVQEYGWSLWRVPLWLVELGIPVGSAIMTLYLSKELAVRLGKGLTPPSEKDKGIFSKPALMIPIWLALIGFSIYFITVNPVLGTILLVLAILFGGLPIFPALGLVGMIGTFLLFGGFDGMMYALPRVSYESMNNFALVCIPLFMLVGQILSDGGVGEELFKFCSTWTSKLPGGEAVASVLACSIFAAISASSVATAATIGLVALPALARRKYNKNFSYGILAAGGTLGIMIPPSGSMIIYSAVTEESLGKLFLAGMIPGVILAGAFCIYCILYCLKTRQYEKIEGITWRDRFSAFRTGMWGLLAPLIIIGGIYSGIFTPLESGAIAVIYALIMTIVRKKIKIKDIPKTLTQSCLNSTMILSIIIGAIILGNLITLMRVPNIVMDWVVALEVSRWTVMLAIMGLYIILGMFLDVIACMMITLPVIYPLILSLGFDGIWFAVMVTLNMEIALITPPVGLNLYVIQGIAKVTISKVLRGVFPFFFIMLVGLVFYALFPGLSTWLPSIMITR